MGGHCNGGNQHSFGGTFLMDSYKTILKPSPEILFKEKKSKFYGYALPLQSEGEAKAWLEQLWKKHHTANHVCYAWQIGVEDMRYRANDDGEPNNSAGMPIYGQIQSFEVTNVLVAVARIFGGTKLGVGGLISSYREAAKMALQASCVVERKLKSSFQAEFEYSDMNNVMALIKRLQLEITSQTMMSDCKLVFSVDRENENKMLELFAHLHKVRLVKLD